MPSQMLNEVEVESNPDSSAVKVVVSDERDLRPMDRVCLTLCDNETGRGEQLSSVQFSSPEAWWSLASEGLVFLVNNEWKWSPTHFDSSIRYNSVARRPRDRLMIMAAEE